MNPRERSTARPRRRAADAAGVLVRRDAVFVPFTLVGFGAVAFAVSQMMRPAGEISAADRTIVIGAALAVGALAIALGGLTALLWGKVRLAPGLTAAAYLGALGLLTAGVTTAAVHDGGLDSIAMLVYALLAPYLALVLPAKYSAPAVAGLLGLVPLVALLAGGASLTSAVLLVILITAGYVAGLLPRRGMTLAAARAVRFARSDALTGLLNRRGFEGEADYTLAQGAAAGQPVALLAIDLNGFKLVNDQHGHAAGDELLAWVGQRLAEIAPADAIVGRTGGDEFAILLPAVTETAAEASARVVHAALAERVGASIGVAARSDGAADRTTLLREADAALYAAKSDPTRRVHVREIGSAVSPPDAAAPALSFADLRARRDEPEGSLAVADPLWLFHGHLMAHLIGSALIGAAWLWGGDGFWLDWYRWAGLAWMALSAVVAVFLRRHPMDPDQPSMWLLGASTAVTAFGMMNATLAFGGPTSPVAGAFILAVMHDATVVPFRDASRNAIILGAFWLAVVLFGPQGALWAVPFEVMLLLSALLLGWVCRRALVAATTTERGLATTDALTGLLNRQAVREWVRAERARRPGSAGAVLALDLDGFKQINDEFGHAAGDRLLADVAAAARDELDENWVIGRVGGDEFMAFAAHIGERELHRTVDRLHARLLPLIGASIGTARFGVDGDTPAEVADVADRRSYAAKQQSRARHLRSA